MKPPKTCDLFEAGDKNHPFLNWTSCKPDRYPHWGFVSLAYLATWRDGVGGWFAETTFDFDNSQQQQ